MSVHRIREKINLSLYAHKQTLLKTFRIISLFVSLVAVATLVYYHGFPQTEASGIFLIKIIKGSFLFYVLHYFIRVFYDFHPLKFIRRTWLEGLMMFTISIDGISDLLFHHLIIERFFFSIGFETYADISTVFIQFYLFAVVVLYIFRTSAIIPKIKVHPATLFILSFALIIFCGAFLLQLPEMTTIEGSMSFIDALFTAASATCVTGLAVVDTATFFTLKGQIIILALIKLGGLNILLFSAFSAIASKFGFRVQHHEVIEGFVNRDSVLSAQGMLGKIFLWSIIIEIIGTALIYLLWLPSIHFNSVEQKVFFSVFHSVSAFNNAGFSIFTDGFLNEAVRFNYLVHIVIAALVFFGSLGFIPIFDLFSVKNLRERLRYPWKEVGLGTKIALNVSLILIFSGAILFFILESENSLTGKNFVESIITSFFQAIVPRTAGFNTVDIGTLTVPVLVLLIFLMFIGASSSSTGGGIKTSTFTIVLASVFTTISGKKNVELFKRTINNTLVRSAIAISLFYASCIFVAVFILSITETDMLLQSERSVFDLIFEEVSALSTVGLSTGITSQLSFAGKIIIILTMFIGRVGTLTIAFAVGKKAMSTSYKYPTERILVG